MRPLSKYVMLLIILVTTLSACAISIPTDPEDSLEQIRNGTLRVGVSHSEPWVVLHDNDAPSGTEVDLVLEFARTLSSEVQWVPGGEETLMDALSQGDLDVVIGGLTERTPWTAKAAITRTYVEAPNQYGENLKHVMAVPMGENALLSELETFLDQAGSAPAEGRDRK